MLSNVSSYAPTDVGNFSFLNPAITKFSGNVFNSASVNDSPDFSSSSTSQQKEYTSAQQKELDRFLGDFLFNSSLSALDTISAYNDSVGWLGVKHMIVNGFKVLTGQTDRIELEEEMEQALKDAKKLRDAAYSQPGSFESQIERNFGIPYSHANVEELKRTSEEFTRVSVYHDKTELLRKGFSEVRRIIQQEQEYARVRKYVRGAAAASLQPPNPSSHEKFGEILLQLCNGDKDILNEYMKNLSSEMGSRSEIEKNLPQIMEELLSKCEAQEQEALGDKTYTQYKQEYETACKKVFGTKSYKDTAESFVENAKMQAEFTDIGLTIATSILLPQSRVVKTGVQKMAARYGERTALSAMKGTMTVTTGSMPAVMTTLNAATSEAGFTPEAIEEIKEKFKNGLMYGGFGAYVSSPLGLAVEKVLSKNPTMLSNIVSKTMGTATETTADVLFDRMTSDLSFVESLKQNGIMNFGMMIAGGQVNRALSKLSVTKTDNGYSVKDKTGKEVFKAEDENALAGFVMGKGNMLIDITPNTPMVLPKEDPANKLPAVIIETTNKINIVSQHEKEIEKLLDMVVSNRNNYKSKDIERYKQQLKKFARESSIDFVSTLLKNNVKISDLAYYIQASKIHGDDLTLSAVKMGVRKSNLNEFLEVLPTIQKELKKAQEDYNIKNDEKLFLQYPYDQIAFTPDVHATDGDDKHIRLISANGNVFKFDKTTGKLLAISYNNKTINLQANTTSNTNMEFEATDFLINALSKQGIYNDELINNCNNIALALLSFTPTKMDIIINKNTGEQVSHDIFLESETSSRQIDIRNQYGEITGKENIKGITGEYEIYSIDPNGKKYLTGLAEIDKNGGKHVEKHLKSLDGTETNTVYADDVSGNTFLYYEIKDNDGNILYQSTKIRKQLSDNHYQTTNEMIVNDSASGKATKVKKSYDIQITADKVIVAKLNEDGTPTQEKIEYIIKDFTEEEFPKLEAAKTLDETISVLNKLLYEHNIPEYTLDRKLLPMLTKLSGEEWGKLNNNEVKLIIKANVEEDDAINAETIIGVSDTLKDDITIFLHEAGHSSFSKLQLYDDPVLNKIYEEEKERFTTTFPDEMIENISYFLSSNQILSRGMNETTAETNIITNTHSSARFIEGRTAILQKYFPRTIAYIANKTAM